MGLKMDLGGIQYIVVIGLKRKMEFFAFDNFSREINMPGFNFDENFKRLQMQMDSSPSFAVPVSGICSPPIS